MSNTNTVLQVPISKSLRAQALKTISQMGFSSLQEYIRVFLTQTVNQNVTLRFHKHKNSKKKLSS